MNDKTDEVFAEDPSKAKKRLRAEKTAKTPRVKAPRVKSEKAAKPAVDKVAKKKGELTGDPSEYPDYSAFKPAASLLPAYIRDRRANDKTVRITLYSCLGVLALVVAIVGFTFFYELSAQTARNDAQNDRQAAQVEADRLKPIADYYDGLKERQDLATAAMQADLDRPRLINQIQAAARGRVQVTGIDISGQPPCQGPDPFKQVAALGCINVTVEGPGTQVAAFVDALNKNSLFSSAYSEGMFSGGEAGAPVTVNYSSAALTMRFVPAEEREAARAAVQEQVSLAGVEQQ